MPRSVVVVGFPDAQSLDIIGPTEVFSAASRLRPGSYTVEVCAAVPGRLPLSSGVALHVDRALADVSGKVDTLIVAGGLGVRAALGDAALLAALRSAARRARRVASVCTGAFFLAELGLLDGRRAVTHWASCERLAARYPDVRVERDPIFVRDGKVWTSAGVTAGMDLALALVEDDHDRALALEIARWLVVYLKRPGGQAQFSAPLAAQRAERAPVAELQSWATEHPAEDLSVTALARRAGMSPRNFARVFRREVGRSPARWAEAVRLEAARRLLEGSARGLADIAAACGFGAVETLHRRFKLAVGVTPAEYRRRFAHTDRREVA